MAAMFIRSFISCSTVGNKVLGSVLQVNLRGVQTASCLFAARKGTREKARAKKVKVEVTKVGFIPKNQRKRGLSAKQVRTDLHLDDSYKQISTDDVFPTKYYRWVVYPAEEAINLHKETHHPTMYNEPESFIFARIHLNMEAAKKTRTMENFTRIALIPHGFPRDDKRTILVFCKGQEAQKDVVDAGATLAGGVEIVKKIQDGEIKLPDYDHVIAHPNILTDLVPIRGLLKRKFPNIKNGTLVEDLPPAVRKYASGIQYKVIRDEHQKNFAAIDIPIGRINMDSKHVAENLEAILKDLDSHRPKREGQFITRCVLVSPPSPEQLKIDPFVYVKESIVTQQDEDSDEEDEKAAATA